MNALRLTIVLLALAILVCLGTTSVNAEDPVASANPANAPFIDNQAHPIAANASTWNRFDYKLSDSGAPRMTTIKLLYGNKSGVGFEIYEPQDMPVYWDAAFKPVIGRGMPAPVRCDAFWCEGDDLIWSGALGASGTYHVRIINNTLSPTTYLLTIEGKGVMLAQPIAVTAVTAPLAKIDDPNRAVILNGAKQIIPANGAFWYRFDYAVTSGDPSPIKTIRLQYGVKSGLRFEIYSPEVLGKWWENSPIGRGVAEFLPCATGYCKGDDLVWVGAFGSGGTYYVRMLNDNTSDTQALLTIQ